MAGLILTTVDHYRGDGTLPGREARAIPSECPVCGNAIRPIKGRIVTHDGEQWICPPCYDKQEASQKQPTTDTSEGGDQ